MRPNLNKSLNKIFHSMLVTMAGISFFSLPGNANYQLVIGSYRQGPGSKPHVSGITSPTLYSIRTETLEQCENAGRRIINEIYNPVWQFDNRWTCIYTGK